MNLLFCHDRLYSRSRDGTVLSYGGFPYSLWEHRFLPHFETMTVVGIKKKVTEKETGVLDISSGKNVRHVLLPDIRSPFRQLLQYFRIRRKITEEVNKADAVIIRGPVDFGVIAATIARKQGKPYAVEMTGCAYDISYFNGTLLGKILAPLKLRQSQKMVRHANAVIYVTERFLQSRYPTDGTASYASNVEIAAAPEYVLSGRLERIATHRKTLNIGLIGNFMGGFRGLDVALNALGIVKAQMSGVHQDFHLKLLGQGGNVRQWEELIAHNALEGKVEFCGAMPAGQSVLEWLDDIDIYLQPSLHEGLPRTMIEAMSRGCAVLASDAGGTGELLENHYIHPRGDAGVLASHILDHLQRPDYSKQAQRNFQKAKNYSSEFLVPRRHQFWADFAKTAKEKSGR